MKLNSRWLPILAAVLIFAAPLPAFQAGESGRRGTLKGRVLDGSGAVIPGANVTVTGPGGETQTVVADEEGSYEFKSLPPARYSLRATAPGFEISPDIEVEVVASRDKTQNLSLTIERLQQEISVEDDAFGQVGVDPQSNVGALVLRGEDLEILSDDPDDLAAELQALAGPSAGPSGGQIFVDGFSGAQIPPKSSIREIRINSDPFSAQYDQLGFGRIQISTKPGTDTLRGRLSFGFSDESLNSRNPFAPNRPPYQSRLYYGNLGGSLDKKTSFFVDFQRREIDDNAVINATILDPGLNAIPFSEAVVTPRRRTSTSPRLDYQLSEKITLTGRYRYERNARENSGIGNFSLPALAYNNLSESHTIRFSETAVLSEKSVNETRLQFRRSISRQDADNSIPTTNVLQAFRDGGAQVGMARNEQDQWEIHNLTTRTAGKHTLMFGGRFRRVSVSDFAPRNFGGTFTFGGGTAPQLDANDQVVLDGTGQTLMIPITSIERYRRTVLFQGQGLTGAQIQALGGGATQFSIIGGDPLASVPQMDLGMFVTDDWRARSNLTVSLGLRYEVQDNISDRTNWAPRLAFAWAPGGGGGKRGKTVIRGGGGIFYTRISRNLTLQALRFNGITQEQFIIQNPDFYPIVPTIAALGSQSAPQTIRALDPDLRAPSLAQTAIGIERQLPFNTTVSSTYTHTRGVHQLRSRSINVPDPLTGIRPFGVDDIFQNEASGVLRQNQWITSVRTRFAGGVSLFGFYSLNDAKSDTDGSGTFPADQFDLSTEYGRSSLDIRHRFAIGGSVTAPFEFRFSPFVIFQSGRPYNITTGRDNNGDLLFTDRPSFATAANLNDPDIVFTSFGAFDPTPEPGATPITRNLGSGPSSSFVNLRITKTIGFGGTGGGQANRANQRRARGGFRPGGGRRRGGFRGGGGRGWFGGSRSRKRYSLSFSVSARNLLNTTNSSSPIGNISSPLFGVSTSSAGFGRGNSSAGNRTISLQTRFSF